MPTIRGGRVLQGGRLRDGDVHIRDGVIVPEAADDDVVDADGLIVSPGFIDIQINGGFGHDFTQDPTTIWAVGERLPELGVTSFVPTVVTSPPEVTDLAIDVVANRRPPGYRGADVLGLHFEGPWISPEMQGAHNTAHIVDPDANTARRWIDSGRVRVVTLAPERPGADVVGARLAEAGVVVSIGHTSADHATAEEALASYASLVTHLFNQMTPLDHRRPGAVAAALLSDRPCILIADGLHIAAPTLDLAWRLLAGDRVVLVTDAMAALGLGPGTYPLGDGPIVVGDDGPRTADGRLAGSVVTLSEALTNLQTATAAPVEQVLATVTANPARILRLTDRGGVTAGSRGDLVLLDEGFGVVNTLLAGLPTRV